MDTKNLAHRTFRTWDLTAGHNQLVLRDPGWYYDRENVDIWFGGVAYMEIIPCFSGIEFAHPTPREVQYIEARCTGGRLPQGTRIYVLVSENKRYYVVAGNMEIDSNSLDPSRTCLGGRTCWPATQEYSAIVKRRHHGRRVQQRRSPDAP
jgi:hypothetical protein